MSLRIGVVVNPRSRYLKRHPEAVGRLRAILGDRGLLVETRTLDEVEPLARRFAADGVEVVGVVGGDGTAGILARGFSDVYGAAPLPLFALLRGGTMNTVANALGLPRGRPEAQLARLLEVTRGRVRPAVVERPTLDAHGRLGFLFGTGVFYNFLEAYYEAGHDDPSAVTAVETISRMAASVLVRGPLARRLVHPHAAVVTHDGVTLPERSYLTLAAGTVAEVGLGFTPFPATRGLDEGFEFLAVHGAPVPVVRELPSFWLGRRVDPAVGFSVTAREVVIAPREGVVDYMVDGDLYASHGPLTLRAGPKVPIVRL